MLTVCVQGSLIALVNDRDMARLIASHKNMIRLLGSAAPALVSTSDTAILDGEGAHMGAGLQVVEAVPFDQSVLLSAITDTRLAISGDIKELKKEVVVHLEKGLKKEGDARKKAMKGMRESLKAQNADLHQRLELHNEDLQMRLELLEQGAASNKKPRHAAEKAPPKIKNIIWNKASDSFGWMRTLKGVPSGNSGFSCAEDATLDMKRFYAPATQGASRQ